MTTDKPDTDELLRRAGRGERSALSRLLERHRKRLRTMIATRMGGRLARRVDPSDVVQDALVDASRRLPEYLRDRTIPYYFWLQRLAIQRLISWRRFHIGSRKRSIDRELTDDAAYPASSALMLLERLADPRTPPDERVIRDEEKARVLLVLGSLGARDREILELHYLKALSFAEIASELGIGVGAVRMRHLRALERFCELLSEGRDGPDG